MNELIVKLRILARAEVTLFKADAQRRSDRALLAAISIGCVFVALIFVNMAAFFALTESDINSRAALILAGVNLGVAVIPFLMRQQSKPGSEEQMVREIREMAAAEISKDISAVGDEIASVGSGIKQLRAGVSSFSSGRGGALGAIGPLLPLVIDLLKRGKD